MAPRALTEQERNAYKEKLLSTAEKLLLAKGIRGVSVDDITKAAGISKGSFYQHYASKESLLLDLVWHIYRGFVEQADLIIKESPSPELQTRVRAFLFSLVRNPSNGFFFANHDDLEYLLETADEREVNAFNDIEVEAFRNLIVVAGLDPDTVKPSVVHNYIHTLYFASVDDSLIERDRDETIAVMLDGLMAYLFRHEKDAL